MDTDLQPAPVLEHPPASSDTWERERAAFFRLLPSLLRSHAGEYVAVHDGRVVGSGPDQVEVALRAYEAHGYVPIFVGLVTDQPPRAVRVPSPRIIHRPGD